MTNNLLTFRRDNKLTQKEIAEILGITYSFYSKIELGERNPSYNFLVKFKENFSFANIDAIFFANQIHKV